MYEAKGGLMLTEHLLGVPLPRHLNSLIAQIPGVGAAFAAMLPIVGVMLAITIIAKLIEKHNEHLEVIRQTKNSLEEMSGEGSKALTALDDKVLAAGKTLDELSHNKIAALNTELKMIDHKSLEELNQFLAQSITEAEKFFKLVKPAWYEFDKDVKGAQTGLEDFSAKYGQLINQGQVKEAGELLAGTLDAAKAKLEEMKAPGQEVSDEFGNIVTAANEVTRGTEKDIQAQNEVVRILQQQVDAAERIKTLQEDKEAAAAIAAGQKANAEDQQNRERALSSKKETAETKVKIAEDAAQKEFAAGKITSEQLVTAEKDAADKRLQAERDFIQAKIALEMSSNDDRATTVSKVAALHEHLQNLEREHTAKLGVIDDEAEKRANAAGEKLYAENTRDAREKADAIEESLRGEAAVREANTSSIEMEARASSHLAEVKAKVAETSVKSGASSGLISKQQEQEQLKAILVKEETDRQASYAVELAAAQKQANDLAAAAKASDGDSDEAQKIGRAASAQARLNQMIAQNMQLTSQNTAAINAADVAAKRLRGDFGQWIRDMKRDLPSTAKLLQNSFGKAFDSMNSGIAHSLLTGKNFGKEMRNVGEQLLQSVIEQEMKKLEVYVLGLIQKRTTSAASDAAAIAQATAKVGVMKALAASEAGAWAFESVMAAVPFPANTVQAPITASLAMTQAMAFAEGGKVPGYGRADTVPAMLMPGETVVSKALTQQVANSQGGASQGHTIQHNPTYYIQMIDAHGVRNMLQKHDQEFQKHAVSTMRKMNTRVGRG